MNLKREIYLNKKVIVFVLLLNIIGLCSYYSYALFRVNLIKNGAIEIHTASSLDITTTIGNTNSDTFTLPASGTVTKTIYLDTNGITSAMAYKMYYELTGDGKFTVTSTESFTDDKIEGVMQPITKTGYDYKVTGKDIVLTFTNNSTNSLTIKLGAIGGLEKTGASLTTEEELLVNTELPVSQGGGNTPSGTPTMAEMCPECVYTIGISDCGDRNYGYLQQNDYGEDATIPMCTELVDNWNDLESDSFLELIYDKYIIVYYKLDNEHIFMQEVVLKILVKE